MITVPMRDTNPKWMPTTPLGSALVDKTASYTQSYNKLAKQTVNMPTAEHIAEYLDPKLFYPEPNSNDGSVGTRGADSWGDYRG